MPEKDNERKSVTWYVRDKGRPGKSGVEEMEGHGAGEGKRAISNKGAGEAHAAKVSPEQDRER